MCAYLWHRLHAMQRRLQEVERTGKHRPVQQQRMMADVVGEEEGDPMRTGDFAPSVLVFAEGCAGAQKQWEMVLVGYLAGNSPRRPAVEEAPVAASLQTGFSSSSWYH